MSERQNTKKGHYRRSRSAMRSGCPTTPIIVRQTSADAAIFGPRSDDRQQDTKGIDKRYIRKYITPLWRPSAARSRRSTMIFQKWRDMAQQQKTRAETLSVNRYIFEYISA
ncbi:MAG: hypothetical protein KUL75_07710 [Sterolibacterium sp.]|nr:hypothetical protein [Sterolibacterium sp.]